MESFFYVAQKTMNPALEPYVFTNRGDKLLKFSEMLRIGKKEYDCLHDYVYLEVMNDQNKKMTKFQWLNSILENMFCSDKFKERAIDLFGSIQKKLSSFSRIAYLYKLKKAPIKIKTDIFLNPIKETDKNVMCIFDSQNLCKYLFTITDLMQIIKKSLMHAPNFFSDPSDCKNPYTNIPFNKSTLYNIYFFIRQRNYVMPQLIHNFFIENFDLERFRKNNLFLIRENAIKDHVDNMETQEAVDYIHSMLRSFYPKKVYISDDFPKQRLITIMKPYLYYYFTSIYSLCFEKKHEYYHKLESKLRKFFRFNPKFGKKYLKLQAEPVLDLNNINIQNPFDTNAPQKQKHVIFDDKHINFYEKDDCSFLTSHIKNKDDDDASDESEEEEDLAEDVSQHLAEFNLPNLNLNQNTMQNQNYTNPAPVPVPSRLMGTQRNRNQNPFANLDISRIRNQHYNYYTGQNQNQNQNQNEEENENEDDDSAVDILEQILQMEQLTYSENNYEDDVQDDASYS